MMPTLPSTSSTTPPVKPHAKPRSRLVEAFDEWCREDDEDEEPVEI